MPRFAANLTMLFNEVAFLDRFERAAKAGFDTTKAYQFKPFVPKLPEPLGEFHSFAG